MTDLNNKFSTLESQLSTQHTAIGNKLDAILTALGAPPPTATTTLGDISTQLSALNDTLNGLLTAQNDFYASNLGVLDLINTSLDLMLNNSSLNAQRLLNAILSTACACDTTAPALPPIIDVTPTTLIDEDKCRRIQYYLSIFGNWLSKIANYGSTAGYITGDTLGTLLGLAAAEAGLAATGAEVGAVGGPPGAVIGAVIGLITGAIFALGGSVLQDYAAQFNAPELRASIVQAMYAEDNASAGRSAFHTVILANMSTVPAEIIYALFWAAWSNDIYSDSPVVDASAFDGSLCAPPPTELTGITSCTTFASVRQNFGGSDYEVISVGTMYAPNPSFIAGNFLGFTIRELTGSETHALFVHYITEDLNVNFTGFLSPGGIVGIDHVTLAIRILTVDHDADAFPFTVEICPPT